MFKKIVLVLGLVGLTACEVPDAKPPANGVPISIAVATFKNKCVASNFSNARYQRAFKNDRNFVQIDTERTGRGSLTSYAHRVLFMIGLHGTIDRSPVCGISFAPNTTVTQAFPVVINTVARVLKTGPIGENNGVVIFQHKGGRTGVSVSDKRDAIHLLTTKISGLSLQEDDNAVMVELMKALEADFK